MGKEKNRTGRIWCYMLGGIGSFEEAAKFADRDIEEIEQDNKKEAVREFKRRYSGDVNV